jgi:DNA polymerase-3 subunit alpha
VVQALTGLPAAAADRFRKRVVKHRTPEEAAALAVEFLEACTRHGTPRAAALEQWQQLAGTNHYSFCKSHAVSYGLIAWTAAYLKAHDPLAFWTAALNNNQGVYPRRVYVEAVKRAGIDLQLPCVNRSEGPFTPEGGALRVGLDAIASLDEAVWTAVLAERGRGGPYRDLADFRRRVAPPPEALSLLIRCGALDFTGRSRPALFLEADLDRRAGAGGGRLFADDPDLGWSPADYAADRRLQDEWELLGFLVGPPLLSLCRPRLPPDLVTSRQLPDHLGKWVRLAGMVAASRHAEAVDGREVQFVTLEDEWGLIELTLFPGTCPSVAYLRLGPYLATGVVEDRFGVVALTAHSFRLHQSKGLGDRG